MADNSEFLEVTSPATLKNLQAVNAELLKTIASVKDVNANMIGIKTPSGSDSAIKKLTADYDAQAKTIQNLQNQLQQLAIAKGKDLKTTQQQKTDTQILNVERRREAVLASQVAGEYRKLSAQVAIASDKYQNLIVRGRSAGQSQREYNRELRNAQREFQNLQDRVLAADRAVGRWNRTNERTVALGRDLLNSFGVVGGVTAFALITKDIFEQTKEIQSLNNALKQVTETQANYYAQQLFIQKTAQDFGLDINSLTKQFTQFYVSAKDKISGTEIQNIFRSVAKAGATMGLSVEQQERAFLALNQMMSKGVVSAEELRGQLGEALPGAFGIMAKAVGVTEQELGKMLKSGELLASDVLPKFAKQLEITYGIENVKRVENLASAQTRLSNSWRNFVESLDKDGNTLSTFFAKILNVTTKIVQGIELIFENSASKRERQLKAIGDSAYNAEKENLQNMDELKKQNAITEREYVRDRILDLKNEIKTIKDRNKTLEGSKDGTYGNAIKVRKEQMENNKSLYALNNSLSYNIGLRRALDEALQENVKSLLKQKEEEKKALETKRENVEAINFESDAYEGLLARLKSLREGLVKMREANVNNNEEFEKFNKLIEYYQTLIDSIEHNQLTESAQKRVAEFKKLNESMADTSKKTKELTKEQQAFFQQFQEGFFGDAGLPTLFKYLNGDLDEFTKNWQGQFEVITQIAQEAFKFISDASNKNFENEYANLEKQKNISLAFAGDDAAAKEEIQRQYEERRKKIAAREFKAKKEQALFNIAIDTAQAAVATLARTPLPAGLPFLIATLALGAAEAAIVASQQAPQFWRGTDNAPEGLAWTQEKGREIITDKFGNIKSKGSDKGAQLTYLNKGDKVLNNEKTMDYLMFDNSLNSILTGNNISTPIIEVNNSGISDSQVNKIVSAIENKAEFSQLISNGDLKTVIRKGNTETEIMNRRINFLGKKV